MRWFPLLLLFAACGNPPCIDSCPGCCDVKDVCQTGDQLKACGVHGMVCVACLKDQVCTAGVCSAPPCGPDTCTGCCDVNGRCVVSATDGSCGLAGVDCVQCSFGQGCQNGVCKNCLPSSYGCSSDASCCSMVCGGLTAFQMGTCN
jgi:hypothetical protein